MNRLTRTLLALTAVAMIAGACSSDSSNAGGTTGEGTTGGTTGGTAALTLTMHDDNTFSPANPEITAGTKIDVRNGGKLPHTFTITSANINVDLVANANGTADTSGLAAGTYDFVCVYHKSLGMEGKLTVK